MTGPRQSAATTPSVVVIGPLPPPVHGAALITAHIADKLREKGPVQVCDVSPGRLERGFRYHLTRVRRNLAAAQEVANGGFGAGGAVYLSAAGRSGLFYNMFLAAAARILRREIFVHHNSFAYIDRNDWRMSLLVKISGPTTTPMCGCAGMERRFRDLYGVTGRVVVLSNGAFYPPSSLGPKPDGGPLRLGHMSNLSREKGLDLVFDVFRALRAEGDAARLILAGPPVGSADAALIEQAREEFGGALEYRGPLYDDAKQSFLSEIDVFVFPTRYRNEADPMVLYEAMANGVPVIAYGRGCIPWQLSEGGGIAIAPGADFVGEAVAGLSRWANDRSALARASRAALDRARQCHDEGAKCLENLAALICSSASLAAPAAIDHEARHEQ